MILRRHIRKIKCYMILVQVIDRRGRVVASAAPLAHRDGLYLPWLMNRAVLGLRGDTIAALILSSGRLLKYVPKVDDAIFRFHSAIDLPRYFEAPEPKEEVLMWPWINQGPHPFVHNEVSHVETATFAGDRLYTLRNYDAEWVQVDKDTFYDTKGLWRVTSRGLEVYDFDGTRLARLAIPSLSKPWIRADMEGRMFVGSGDSIVVVSDPTTTSGSCPAMPAKIAIPVDDVPPRR